MTKRDARLLLDGVFEEEALVIGGLLTVHQVDDAFIDRLFRSHGAIRSNALRRLEGRDTGGLQRGSPSGPHPAVEAFLDRLRGSA